jgi:acyl carrier protein
VRIKIMKAEDIKKIIDQNIMEIAKEKSIPLDVIDSQKTLVEDLGFKSMDMAVLIAGLEDSLKIDPFSEGDITIGDIRTVDDLYKIYCKE